MSLQLAIIFGCVAQYVFTEQPCSDHQLGPCTCTMAEVDPIGRIKLLNCSRRNLSLVPDNLSHDAGGIDFSGNTLLMSDISSFVHFPHLLYLSLAENGLKYIMEYTFANMSSLRRLDLTGNHLQSISAEIFDGLQELEALDGLQFSHSSDDAFCVFEKLRNLTVSFTIQNVSKTLFGSLKVNYISMEISQALSLPEEFFSFGRHTLTELHIESKSMLSLPANLLDGLYLLKVFRLKVQSIHSLPYNFFHGVSTMNNCAASNCKPVQLREVEIHGVKNLPKALFNRQESIERISIQGVEDLQGNIFNALVTLDELSLSHSKLFVVYPTLFGNLCSLKSLILRNTSLTSVKASVFHGLSSLINLDLSINSLTAFLPDCPYRRFCLNLGRLNLSRNLLTSLSIRSFNDMHYLSALDLSNNRLTKLNSGIFQDLNGLELLFLQNNSIRSLPALIFGTLRQLRVINMAENNLEFIPDMLFQSAKSLRIIDFSKNFFTTLPGQIFLSNVRLFLNLEHNPLHCDCKFGNSVARWIALTKVQTLKGHCVTPGNLYHWPLNLLTHNSMCSAPDHTIYLHVSPVSKKVSLKPRFQIPRSTIKWLRVASNEHFTSEAINTLKSPSLFTARSLVQPRPSTYTLVSTTQSQVFQIKFISWLTSLSSAPSASSPPPIPLPSFMVSITPSVLSPASLQLSQSLPSQHVFLGLASSSSPHDGNSAVFEVQNLGQAQNISSGTSVPTSIDTMLSKIGESNFSDIYNYQDHNKVVLGGEPNTNTTNLTHDLQTLHQRLKYLSLRSEKFLAMVEEVPSMYVAVIIILVSISIGIIVAFVISYRRSNRESHEVTPASSSARNDEANMHKEDESVSV